MARYGRNPGTCSTAKARRSTTVAVSGGASGAPGAGPSGMLVARSRAPRRAGVRRTGAARSPAALGRDSFEVCRSVGCGPGRSRGAIFTEMNRAHLHVLLVEDDAKLARLTRDYLEQHELVVTTVGDGNSAVREGMRPDIDVIVLDLMLPGRDGFEVCRELRERVARADHRRDGARRGGRSRARSRARRRRLRDQAVQRARAAGAHPRRGAARAGRAAGGASSASGG